MKRSKWRLVGPDPEGEWELIEIDGLNVTYLTNFGEVVTFEWCGTETLPQIGERGRLEMMQ